MRFWPSTKKGWEHEEQLFNKFQGQNKQINKQTKTKNKTKNKTKQKITPMNENMLPQSGHENDFQRREDAILRQSNKE